MRTAPAVVDDPGLGAWRAGFDDVTPIAGLVARREHTTVGVVDRMRVTPGRALTVRLVDGSGALEVVWTGRQTLPGLTLGTALRVTALVVEERPGHPTMRNPVWAPVAEPFA